MDEIKLKELNKLKEKIDNLDNFMTYTSSVTVRLFGKKLNFLRKNTYNRVEYDIPKEIHQEVMSVLWRHLAELNKKFENGEVE